MHVLAFHSTFILCVLVSPGRTRDGFWFAWLGVAFLNVSRRKRLLLNEKLTARFISWMGRIGIVSLWCFSLLGLASRHRACKWSILIPQYSALVPKGRRMASLLSDFRLLVVFAIVLLTMVGRTRREGWRRVSLVKGKETCLQLYSKCESEEDGKKVEEGLVSERRETRFSTLSE